ncbi:hypothetical protein Droror1_Dr00021271 [Drosera rotundifolia]
MPHSQLLTILFEILYGRMLLLLLDERGSRRTPRTGQIRMEAPSNLMGSQGVCFLASLKEWDFCISTCFSHPLVLTALSSLNSELLSEAAVNVTSELIHCSVVGSLSDASAQMPLIQVIVPRIMSLKPLLKDPSKAIARLFADMGDSYVKLVAIGSQESMMIVHALLEVASHQEFYIASMTFNFWHSLQIYLTEREINQTFGEDVTIEAEKNRRLQIFRPSFESLVSLLSFRVQYPKDYQELSEEDMKDFKQTRYAVADVLVDAALVLGSYTEDSLYETCGGVDNIIVPCGPTITRILIASLTGALPSSRFETVTYALGSVVRAYGVQALQWAKEAVSLIPSSAVKEAETMRFLQALSDAASGVNINTLMAPIEELSDVCRRNRTVQEIVQGALRPQELNLVR